MNKTNNNKEYVPNNVYKFKVNVDIDVPDIYVYTNPDIHNEDLVQEQYFTKEKIDEIKEQIKDAVKQGKFTIDIYCDDWDGDYKVTADQIFNVKLFINEQKQMPGEFQQIIQENFWDLVD